MSRREEVDAAILEACTPRLGETYNSTEEMLRHRYRAIYDRALEDAAKAVEARKKLNPTTMGDRHNSIVTDCAAAIRALKSGTASE